jgi:hypothetical protein
MLTVASPAGGASAGKPRIVTLALFEYSRQRREFEMSLSTRTLLRRIGSTMGGVVLVLGATTMVASPAQAAPEDCPNDQGHLCFWTEPGFGGRMGKVEGTNDDWRQLSTGCGGSQQWNDCASAIRNEGNNCEAVVYEHSRADGRGASWVINRETEAHDLSRYNKPSGGNWNNVISSNTWWCG